MKTETILIVDDEQDILDTFKRQFRKEEYKIFTANSGSDGLVILNNHSIDLIISDMRMPEMNGAEFLSKVYSQYPSSVRILLTGYAEIDAAVQAINEGAIFSFQKKPWEFNELKHVIQKSLDFKRVQDENRKLLEITRCQNIDLEKHNDKLEKDVEDKSNKIKSNLNNIVLIIAQLIERIEVNSDTESPEEIANLAKQFAQKCGLDKREMSQVYIAALIHRIGLLGVADELKNTPYNSLDDKKKKQCVQIPLYAESVAEMIFSNKNISRLLKRQYEYLDGTGYPDQLTKDKLTASDRVIAIIRTYCTLSKTNNTSGNDTIQLMETEYTKKLDEEFLEIFKSLFQEKQKKKISIESNDLIPNMILAKPIANQQGVVLLGKGTTLTYFLIKKIKKFEKINEAPFEIEVYTSE